MHACDYCIVVAEDDEILRYCTVKLLRQHGYKVIEARDGREALDLEIIEKCEHVIHLLVTNNDMPQLTGLELARKLKTKHEKLAVLLVSGSISEADLIEPELQIEVMQGYSDGADDHDLRMVSRGAEVVRRSRWSASVGFCEYETKCAAVTLAL